MTHDLNGKNVLVTGGSGGIGKAIAKALSAEGASVFIHGRNKDKAERVAKEVMEQGGNAKIVIGSLDTDAGANRVISEIRDQCEGLDILVNNAGAFEVCRWWQGSAQRWIDTFNTNVTSMVRMVHGLVPAMRDKGWGRIIQISSVAATLAPPLFPDYAAAKAAVLNLSVTLAKELAGSGITVNTVSPGPIVTETWEAFARQIADLNGWSMDIESIKENLLKGFLANPSGRLGSPEDVANAVLFLASPRSGFINGMNLKVDGGLNASIG